MMITVSAGSTITVGPRNMIVLSITLGTPFPSLNKAVTMNCSCSNKNTARLLFLRTSAGISSLSNNWTRENAFCVALISPVQNFTRVAARFRRWSDTKNFTSCPLSFPRMDIHPWADFHFVILSILHFVFSYTKS